MSWKICLQEANKLLYHLYGIFISFVMFRQDVVIMGFIESGFHCKKITGQNERKVCKTKSTLLTSASNTGKKRSLLT